MKEHMRYANEIVPYSRWWWLLPWMWWKAWKEWRKLREEMMSDPDLKPEHKIYYVGRRNVYACPACKHKHVTVALVEGAIPFMLICPHCKKSPSHSTLYDVPRCLLPLQEFYKPDSVEYFTLNDDMKYYVDRGALLIRPVPDDMLKALLATGSFVEAIPLVTVASVDLDKPMGQQIKTENFE